MGHLTPNCPFQLSVKGCTPASTDGIGLPRVSVDDGRRPESGKATQRGGKGSNTWHSIKRWAKEARVQSRRMVKWNFSLVLLSHPIQSGTRGGFAAEIQLFRSNAGYRLRFAMAVDAHRHGKSESRPGLTPDSIAVAQLATNKRERECSVPGSSEKAERALGHTPTGLEGCDFSHDKGIWSYLTLEPPSLDSPVVFFVFQNSVSPLACELGDAASKS